MKQNVLIRIIIILLCALDICLMYMSHFLWQGVHSEDSLAAIVFFGFFALSSLGLEFMIVLLPKSLKFTIPVLIVFNIVFISIYCYTLSKFGITMYLSFNAQPMEFNLDGIRTFIEFAMLPILNIGCIVAAFIIRKRKIK